MVGYHLARAFQAAGHDLVCTLSRDRRSYSGIESRRLENLEAAGITFDHLDLCQGKEAIEEFIERWRPDVWIHHAGYAADYSSPNYDLAKAQAANIGPLAPIFAGLGKHGARGVLVTGTASEYGDSDLPHVEDEACWPGTGYGVLKLAATLLARILGMRHGIRVRVARLFLPFGSLDKPEKILPYTVERLASGQPCDLSPCTQKRDFVYIDDVARAYLAMMQDLDREAAFDVFNIASGEAIELRWLLEQVAEKLGADPSLLRFGVLPFRTDEAPIICGSRRKAEAVLGWKPTPIEDGLSRFVGTPRAASKINE